MGITSQRYLAFLVVLHVILFYAGTAGMITNQQGDNPHLKVINTFSSPDNATKSAQMSGDSGVIKQTFSPIVAISDLINTIVGLLASPYTTIQATPLPGVLRTLFQVLMGLYEIITAYQLATGGL